MSGSVGGRKRGLGGRPGETRTSKGCGGARKEGREGWSIGSGASSGMGPSSGEGQGGGEGAIGLTLGPCHAGPPAEHQQGEREQPPGQSHLWSQLWKSRRLAQVGPGLGRVWAPHCFRILCSSPAGGQARPMSSALGDPLSRTLPLLGLRKEVSALGTRPTWWGGPRSGPDAWASALTAASAWHLGQSLLLSLSAWDVTVREMHLMASEDVGSRWIAHWVPCAPVLRKI